MTEKNITFELDKVFITFTPEGKVAVLDAIQAVTDLDCPESLWQRLTSEHPDVLNHCESRPLNKETEELVVDVTGWERIWMLLPEYLADGC